MRTINGSTTGQLVESQIAFFCACAIRDKVGISGRFRLAPGCSFVGCHYPRRLPGSIVIANCLAAEAGDMLSATFRLTIGLNIETRPVAKFEVQIQTANQRGSLPLARHVATVHGNDVLAPLKKILQADETPRRVPASLCSNLMAIEPHLGIVVAAHVDDCRPDGFLAVKTPPKISRVDLRVLCRVGVW